MDVLVVLATHRPRMHWLKEQLESLRAQRDVRVQLLLSDDSGGDPNHQTRFELEIRRLGPEECQIRFQPHALGVARAFETALHEGLAAYPTTKWIAFCDQDDRWKSNKLSRLLRVAHDQGASLVHSDAELIGEDGASWSQTLWQREHRQASRVTVDDLLVRNVVTGCTMLLRREIAEKMLPFPPSVRFHDHWAALVAAARGTGIASVAEPLVEYRQHAGNVVGAQTGAIENRPWLRADQAARNAFDESRRWLDALEARGYVPSMKLQQKFRSSRARRAFGWIADARQALMSGEWDRSVACLARGWGSLR